MDFSGCKRCVFVSLQSEAVGKALPEMTFTYTHMHCILYALGVGMSTKQPEQLKFLYEGHEDFSCLPTFGVIPAQASMLEGGLSSIPGLNIDPTRVRNSKLLAMFSSYARSCACSYHFISLRHCLNCIPATMAISLVHSCFPLTNKAWNMCIGSVL